MLYIVTMETREWTQDQVATRLSEYSQHALAEATALGDNPPRADLTWIQVCINLYQDEVDEVSRERNANGSVRVFPEIAFNVSMYPGELTDFVSCFATREDLGDRLRMISGMYTVFMGQTGDDQERAILLGQAVSFMDLADKVVGMGDAGIAEKMRTIIYYEVSN